jgi:hypothetical protein
MITPIVAEPLSTGSIGLSDYRNRPASGERTLLPESAAQAPGSSGAGDRDAFPQEKRPPAQPPQAPETDRTAMFAAAVIAGALSPTPQTMEQLIRRIGGSTIPVESEARLKDLLA